MPVAQSVGMNAIELLEDQHHEMSRLFKALATAERADKPGLFRKLAATLCAHDAIERQVFYPACEEVMGLSPDLGEALVEHGVIEFCLYQANEAVGELDFDFKCKVLEEMVEHHVQEEEDEFFPAARKALGDDTIEALGDEMQEAFEDALAEDYQLPLYENLRQVLAGVIQPKAAKSTAESSSDKSATA